MYKFNFADGATCEAGLDHLWNIRKGGEKSRKARENGTSIDDDWHVWDTRKIIEQLHFKRGRSLLIPLSDPIEFSDSYNLPIDPYILGCLLGDGCMTGSSYIKLTSTDQSIIDQFAKKGYTLRQRNDDRGIDYFIISKTIRDELRSIGLYGKKSDTKFIPEIYKYASIRDRVSIIQGLMDTDGYAEKGRTQSGSRLHPKKLSKDVQEIIWSLGGTGNITQKQAGYKDKTGEYKRCLDAHVLYIQTQNNKQLFRLQRKD